MYDHVLLSLVLLLMLIDTKQGEGGWRTWQKKCRYM